MGSLMAKIRNWLGLGKKPQLHLEERRAGHERRSTTAARQSTDSDCLSESVRRSLQTVTDFGQFSRREVNALLLGVCPLLRVVSTLTKAP